MAKHNTKQENLDIIERQAKTSGIPADDFLRFAYIETGGNFDETVSRGANGAKGLFQFMPRTAEQYGIAGQELDAVKNTSAAARLYLDNQKQIVHAHEKSGLPYLSGKLRPDGADMYLAHQQGAEGYTQIQKALAGQDLSDKMRAKMINNVSSKDFERLTGIKFERLENLPDKEFARSFVTYWDTKFDRVQIPEKNVHALGGAGPVRPAASTTVAPAANPFGPSKQIVLESPMALSHKYDDVKYGFGSKSAESGKIDCSGWVGTLVNNAMDEVNRKEGKLVFSDKDHIRVYGEAAADIIARVSKNSKVLLSDGEVTKGSLREGMIIGEDNGPQYDKKGHQWDAGRFKGIDHITMVVRDPKSGELMISQSRGGEGVELTSIDKYLSHKHAKGTHLFATDALSQARGLLASNDKTIDVSKGVGAPPAEVAVKSNESGNSMSLAAVQKQLTALGYHGINGYELKGTGTNGENTIHAVKEFQSAHGLKSDGVAGPKTLEALKHAKDHPLINEAGHPSHGMYEQIKTQTDKLGGAKALGFHSEKEYTQALANMTWQARTSGLTQVDHVVETANKQNLVMIQGGLTDPAQQREVANKAHAAQQPVAQSTQQLQQDVQQLQQQQHHAQSQQQQMAQGR